MHPHRSSQKSTKRRQRKRSIKEGSLCASGRGAARKRSIFKITQSVFTKWPYHGKHSFLSILNRDEARTKKLNRRSHLTKGRRNSVKPATNQLEDQINIPSQITIKKTRHYQIRIEKKRQLIIDLCPYLYQRICQFHHKINNLIYKHLAIYLNC